jgi:hypothetical protein
MPSAMVTHDRMQAMPIYNDACVLCGRTATVTDAPHLKARRFDCSEKGGCTTFEIGADAENHIQKNAARLKDICALVSRAARRKTSEATGTLIIPNELDFMTVAAEQDDLEHSTK